MHEKMFDPYSEAPVIFVACKVAPVSTFKRKTLHFLSFFMKINLSTRPTRTDAYVNSADPDEICLPFCFRFLADFPIAIVDVSKFKDGRVHFGSSGVIG